MGALNEFMATILSGGGVHSPNRYEVIIPGFGGRDVSLLCESLTIPGEQVETFEYPLNALEHLVKVPNGLIHEDLSCTFIVTNDFNVKAFFDRWRRRIIGTNYLLNYPASYEVDIIIKALDQQNNPVYSVKLEGAFPITVGAMALSNATSNEVSRLEVTFTFNRLIPQ